MRATMDGDRVALFDLNADQGNLTQWHVSRGEPRNPELIEVEKIGQDIEVLRQRGFNWLLIDTPPIDIEMIEIAVLKSNAVLIPVRASIFDLGAITPVVEICRERRVPFGFVMSAVDNRFTKLTQKAMSALALEGPILGARVSYRQDYVSSLTAGKVGFEINPDLKPEIDQLWMDVKRLASQPTSALVKERAAND